MTNKRPLPEQMLKAYIEWAYMQLLPLKTSSVPDKQDAGKVDEFIFESFLGQKAMELFMQMTNKNVLLTHGNNIYVGHEDNIFGDLIDEVIKECYDEELSR